MNFLKIQVIRFASCRQRDTARRLSLADYLDAVRSSQPLTAVKEHAPAWALCNSTGDSNGEPNGLVQLDFDHVADPDGLKHALVEYGGFLAVLKTFSGAGLVAIGFVGARMAGNPSAISGQIYTSVRIYLGTRGLSDGADYTLDSACAKSCQLRFESRDPAAWVAPTFVRLAVDPYEDSPLLSHPVAWLAEALRPGGVSPAGIAGAVACISMAANLRSRLVPKAAPFGARAFCAIIGEPGTQKTTLLNTVQDLARALRVVVSDPKNAPTLREHILACGCDEVLEMPQSGKGQPQKRLVERTSGPADSLMVCIDEAGQRLRTRVQDESFGSMAAMLRQCNGDKITLEGTVKQANRGSYRVPAHVSALLATTPAQWAEYIGATGQANGEARRMIELWQDARPSDMFSDVGASPDTETAIDMLRRLHEFGDLWEDTGVVLTPEDSARGAFRSCRAWLVSCGIDAPSADSLIMCYTTLLAGLRASIDGRVLLTVEDLAACAVILRMVLEARGRLSTERERAEAASYKPDSAVWSELMAWIEKSPRRDKLLEKIARRPPQYKRVYNEMLAQRAVTVAKDGTKYIVRPTTAEEIDAGETQADARREAIKAEAHAVQTAQQPYTECSEEDREARVLAYFSKWRQDNALNIGNRNIALNKLAWSLQQAGMWDATARGIYELVAANSGLAEPEIRALMRERKVKK
jgi:hypothetical protein